MPRLNPFRFAKIYLLHSINNEAAYSNLMFTVHAALEIAWIHSPNRKISHKAIKHFKAMVAPYYSERSWLVKTVLNGEQPDEQDMQDYRHHWMDHMAQQWDEGEIK